MRMEDRYRQNQPVKERLSFGGCFGFIAIVGLMYFLILGPEHTFLSLNILLDWTHHLASRERVLAISLIPVYLAVLIFGGGVLGAFFGSYLHACLQKSVSSARK